MQQAIASDLAPKALGPYSQAIRAGQYVFTSGQIGLDPATGKLVGNDIDCQTRQVLNNLGAVLREAGGSLKQAVKTTVFLADMSEFAMMNSVYAEFFTEDRPARSTVQVAQLPAGARVEIEVIAFIP